MLAEGSVRRVLRGVYVASQRQDDLLLRAQAAALILPPHAVVVDRSAAWLWGIDLYPLQEVVPRLDAFVLRGRRRVERVQASGGERDLADRDLVTLRGVPVTTPLRTALDLACGLRRYEALAALDAFARDHTLTRAQLIGELPRFRGRRGVVQARRLVQVMDGRVESPGESFTRLALIEAGLPVPELQFWVVAAGLAYRLDLAYPEAKVAVEYDGVAFHSAPSDVESDQRRRDLLRELGWTVVVVTRESFRSAELSRWTDVVRRACAEAP